MLRDEAKQRSTVVWQGKTRVSYPWGPFDHSERIAYDVDDHTRKAAKWEIQSTTRGSMVMY